ncbi:MAG: type II secretion system protein GspG [Nitrospirae bacterium]|nr:type II secretion system protein GspG [Nitrospirota bacterium]
MDCLKASFFAFLFLLAVFISGCEQKDNSISKYRDSLINSYDRGKKAGAEANLKGIQDAVNAYHAANGAYPGSLQDIEQILGSPVDSAKYQYNPENGEVRLKS